MRTVTSAERGINRGGVIARCITFRSKERFLARLTFPDTPVLYVAGNHEYYGERIGRLQEKMRVAAADSNIMILENETFEFNGYLFFGATLWTDFNLFGDQPFIEL